MLHTKHHRLNKLSMAILVSFGVISLSAQAAQDMRSSVEEADSKAELERAIERKKIAAEKDLEQIVVVGSSIKGSDVTGSLPVTLIDASDIDAIGATSGIELFASIPSNGSVNFNGNDVVSGVYQSRGDVASINLRSIGTGNTLTLLNGRRLVQHPGSQTENSVPVTTVNINSIPVLGIGRVEILHDGAAAIYGSDAVAGVVNTEMRQDFSGFRFDAQYGQAENTSREKVNLNALAGWDLNEGMTNVTVSVNYYHGSEVMASEFDRSSNSDLTRFLEGTRWEGDTNFQNTSTTTQWGRFDASQAVDGLTSSAGRFHVEQLDGTDANQQCVLENGLCIDSGSITKATQGYNTNSARTFLPETERLNSFIFLNHDLGNDTELYGELGYYRAESNSQRAETATLTSAPVTIANSAYWNPLGSGVNRLAGYDIPVEGLDITIDAYRSLDAGPRAINVKNTSYRLLGGARGIKGDWDWDSAALYSAAKTVDSTANRISLSLFQDAVNRQDASAYNTFCAASCNSQDTIDSFKIDVERTGETALGLVDFKMSNAKLFALPAGNVGLAVGTEWRYENFENDYDDRLNGTVMYTDSVTGISYDSDVMGSSAQPNSDGSRNILSAFVEMAGPLVSPDMDIPFVNQLNFQIAGRYERYNDVGDVFKPKAVLSWYPVESLQIRGSYAEGFRAPNLEQLHTAVTSRVNYPTDFYRCQADINKGNVDSFSECSSSDSVSNIRLGNPNLKPEKDYNYGLGLVYTPTFVENLTFTADYWHIKQEDLVGIRSYQNIADLDYYQRLNGGSNSNVIRAEATSDDIAFFEGSGLAPVGDMVEVIGLFENLDSRETSGLDLGAYYKLRDTALGNFKFKVNAAKIIKAFQAVDSESAQLAALGLTLDDVGDLVQMDGRPEWQASGTLTWDYQNWGAGLYGKYVGEFYDTGAVQNDTGDFWLVDSWTTFSIYGQYTFDQGTFENTRVRLGVRNMLDKTPPLADETYGYEASLHNAEGRYVYLSLSMNFD